MRVVLVSLFTCARGVVLNQPRSDVALLLQFTAREGRQYLFTTDVRVNVDHTIDALILRAGCTT